MKKRIAIKIGTSTLTEGTDRISRGKIEDIARQLVDLQEHYEFIIISSGAVAAARQFDKLNDPDELVTSKQALSAIGQPRLMQIYNEIFNDFGLKTAQCLMTYYDFEYETSRINTLNTINTLLKHDYIPIINENDTVAVDELILGDNDKLSALVAVLMNVDQLVIASDIDGIFDSNPNLNPNAKLIEKVENLDDIKPFIEDVESKYGTGGMDSKIKAMEICKGHNIEVFIVNGGVQYFIQKLIQGNIPFTKYNA